MKHFKFLVEKLSRIIRSNRQLAVGALFGVLMSVSFGIYAQVAHENSQKKNTDIEETPKLETSKESPQDPKDVNPQNQGSNIQPQSPNKPKQLCIVLDGNAYCPVVSQQLPTFYYEKIARYVPINSYGTDGNRKNVLGETFHPYFESADCSGTPYILYTNEGIYQTKIFNNLLTAGYNNRYVANKGSTPLKITLGSVGGFNYNSETYTCYPGNNEQIDVVPLTSVNIPVKEPIGQPFEYVYQ